MAATSVGNHWTSRRRARRRRALSPSSVNGFQHVVLLLIHSPTSPAPQASRQAWLRACMVSPADLAEASSSSLSVISFSSLFAWAECCLTPPLNRTCPGVPGQAGYLQRLGPRISAASSSASSARPWSIGSATASHATHAASAALSHRFEHRSRSAATYSRTASGLYQCPWSRWPGMQTLIVCAWPTACGGSGPNNRSTGVPPASDVVSRCCVMASPG